MKSDFETLKLVGRLGQDSERCRAAFHAAMIVIAARRMAEQTPDLREQAEQIVVLARQLYVSRPSRETIEATIAACLPPMDRRYVVRTTEALVALFDDAAERS